MRLTRWQKLWLILALALLFFPAFYIFMELPTEAKILQHWSTSMLWKIQAEVPEYRELGVWYLRHRYQGLSDRALVEVLESEFRGIDYSAIRKKYSVRLETIRTDQIAVIGEAITVYLSVIAILYLNLGFIGWLFARGWPFRVIRHRSSKL